MPFWAGWVFGCIGAQRGDRPVISARLIDREFTFASPQRARPRGGPQRDVTIVSRATRATVRAMHT